VWVHLHRVLYEQARRVDGRAACPSVVIMDGQSVKTTQRGGARGFDAHKRVKGRKRHILVDTLGLLVANRVESADTSDRRAGALLLGGLTALFPRIRTVIADAGHESRKLARTLKQNQGWQLRIVKRRQRAFKITGLTWIVERSFAWLGRNRRLSKDYEYRVQTSETMIDLASIRLMLNQSPCMRLFKHPLRVGSRWWQETALNLARIAETSYFFVKLGLQHPGKDDDLCAWDEKIIGRITHIPGQRTK